MEIYYKIYNILRQNEQQQNNKQKKNRLEMK